ncbi:MAG: DNA recombination protein RmuC [Planctomycetes bacterium]|nr:DNA recombination protein RmuC [Planctomycetota bacterium]
MVEALLIFIAVVVTAVVVVQVILLLRKPGLEIQARLQGVEESLGNTERAMRDEFARSREEAGRQAKGLRDEVGTTLKQVGDSLINSSGEISKMQKDQLAALTDRLAKMADATDRRFEALRETVDSRLKQIQDDNTKKLEQMRLTVDEKLQSTLEKRLGESFKLVSERLEQVHKGLGEMQTLAAGVGDLKRVLTNVKTRGGWGEVRLGALLEQVLAPGQYEKNVETIPASGRRVEYAVKLPGPDDSPDRVVWLPIDAKFPQEDYHRLLDAQEAADPERVEVAAKALERAVKKSAKEIQEKYIGPPATTDFGIMFLPTEGLYAEVLRRAGIVEDLQREFRVSIAGPTTLAALLNSLQMGFRTLAIQKRSSEVWVLLAGVKEGFGKFGDILDGVQKKLGTASKSIEDATRQTRTIERNLRKVQTLPEAPAESDTLSLDQE